MVYGDLVKRQRGERGIKEERDAIGLSTRETCKERRKMEQEKGIGKREKTGSRGTEERKKMGDRTKAEG